MFTLAKRRDFHKAFSLIVPFLIQGICDSIINTKNDIGLLINNCRVAAPNILLLSIWTVFYTAFEFLSSESFDFNQIRHKFYSPSFPWKLLYLIHFDVMLKNNVRRYVNHDCVFASLFLSYLYLFLNRIMSIQQLYQTGKIYMTATWKTFEINYKDSPGQWTPHN